MIITIGKNMGDRSRREALVLADKWEEAVYRERGKKSLKKWLKDAETPIYVVSETGDKLYHPDTMHPLFFHPSMAWIRVLRLAEGKSDPMITAMQLKEGMTVLDTTLGFASDSIVASYVVGKEGSITGIEKNPYIGAIIKKGLRVWKQDMDAFNEAMNRIIVKTEDHLDYLKSIPNNTFDVVYFDPMFQKAVYSSSHLAAIRPFACYGSLGLRHIKEALRVAKQRVVIKSSYPNEYLESLGFTFIKRRSRTSFRYGVIEKKGREQ
ncbi:class I SAM-dependent methyltransferase [Bacillus piscicola]|uniref:class I SAM-dependent methyltransferase n=1 Tax=Bacillus piscicola TaxID=1632684 RepID=UPI001F093321|nr:class I SAM-dependent methyltransferase [Bacillus piscicola]